jgi:type I restriction enzyme, S subunit
MNRSKHITTATEPALVPRLRFPDFQGQKGWEPRKLADSAVILKGKGISKADLDPNGPQPCIRYGELYTYYGEIIDSVASRTSVPASSLFLSKANDVIIPSSGETKLDIATASCVLLDNVALGGDLNVIRSTLNGPFLSYYLNGPKKIDIAKVAQGDTVVHLYPHQLEGQKIAVPSEMEQKKIANCLRTLDQLIDAESQKLDGLRAHKRGLMQKLFPIEGKTLPLFRFPKFRKNGAWREERISEFLQKVSLPVKAEMKKNYREIGVRSHGRGIFHKPLISGATIGEKRVFRVVENSLVLNIVFAWEQAVATTSDAESGMIASHRFPMYVPKAKGCDVRFIKYALLTPWGKHLLGVASPGGAGRNRTLGQNEFEELRLIRPDKDEQTMIADILDAAEHLLGNQVKRIEALNAHKQGLMQQLFPSTIGLGA